MRSLFVITWQTSLLLIRDKVFVPFLFVLGLVGLMAVLGGDVSLWNERDVMLDIGLFGFHIAGSAIAIFWGAKGMSDAKVDGSIELQLAGPLLRSQWLIGRFLGLSITLAFMGLMIIVMWSGLLAFMDQALLSTPEMVTFGLVIMIWIILSALALLFACFCNLAIVVFSCVTLWLLGIMMPLFVETFLANKDIPIVRTLSEFWNLTNFLPGYRTLEGAESLGYEILSRGSYGLALCSVFVGMACYMLTSKDVKR